MKAGDRVQLVGVPKYPATVISVADDRVDIQFDDEPRWPRGDWYDLDELELVK